MTFRDKFLNTKHLNTNLKLLDNNETIHIIHKSEFETCKQYQYLNLKSEQTLNTLSYLSNFPNLLTTQ